MKAEVGDTLVVSGRRVGDPDRRGRVVEVRGAGGGPPYLVEWSDDGHVGLFFPGSSTTVERQADEAASSS